MKKVLLAAVLLPVLTVAAEHPFSGTWKAKPDTFQFSEKPEVWLLQNGRYQCSSCVPKIDIKADGTDQPTPGSKYSDTTAVKIVNDQTVEFTDKKGAKIVAKATLTASVDGKTLLIEFSQYPETSKEPVTGKQSMTRVAAGAAGSHAISGSWRMGKIDAISANALTMTFKGSSDRLTATFPTGLSFDAKFDGKDYPMNGDPAGTLVSLRKLDDRSIEETLKQDGKVVMVYHMTVSSDGKTMAVKMEDKERGTSMTGVAVKQ